MACPPTAMGYDALSRSVCSYQPAAKLRVALPRQNLMSRDKAQPPLPPSVSESPAAEISQTLMVRSHPVEASQEPSGPNCTDMTPRLCPRKVATSRPVAVSQSRTVLS